MVMVQINLHFILLNNIVVNDWNNVITHVQGILKTDKVLSRIVPGYLFFDLAVQRKNSSQASSGT